MQAKVVDQTVSEPTRLLEALESLRTEITEEANGEIKHWNITVDRERHDFKHSIRNLAHYLALRRRDLRDLQAALRPWGLSSLGRIEAQVMPNLDAVIATLTSLSQRKTKKPSLHPTSEDFTFGNRILEAETEAVLGPSSENRRVRMMVTLDSATAQDKKFVRRMLAQGMNIARINCAHDTPETWLKMITNVREAAEEGSFHCKIAMDLGGPKCRTADLLKPKKHRVQEGEKILLTWETPEPTQRFPVQVRCTLPEALKSLEVSSQVWFDDGLIGTRVTGRVPEGIVLEVTQGEGEKLKEDKGINFPGTLLDLDPLTAKDLEDLDFVVQHTDIINYSFVQKPQDIERIQREITDRQPPRKLALIAKIETLTAVKNLPEIIVTAGSQQPFGVMIARGDLAVELGFERLAEMQEEMLWICEAAYVPVVWATQVLETLAKSGRPTRAEITDAAMSERAECVMLNKGDYIIEAMKILDNVLVRMGQHQSKKVPQLRALRSW